MYGYEPSWLDIYINAMANQQMMMPLSSFNSPMPPVDVTSIPPQQPMNQSAPQDASIMVDNQMNQNPPVDNSIGNLSDLTYNGVMNG